MLFTGLYTYIVIPYITEENEHRVKMGCYNRTVKEWDEDFWNNNGLRIYEVRLNELSNYKQMLVGVSCIYAVRRS